MTNLRTEVTSKRPPASKQGGNLTAMSLATIDGTVLTENGDSLDLNKVQAQINTLTKDYGKFQFEMAKQQSI